MKKSISKKFSPSRALRRSDCRFLTKYQSQGLTTEEYVKAHCRMNNMVPTTFIINGREVVG